MKTESTGHIWVERADDNFLYGCDKIDKPDAKSIEVSGLSDPSTDSKLTHIT